MRRFDPGRSLRSEVQFIAGGPAPRVSVSLALAATGGAVAWGNAVVLLSRAVGGNAGEVVTTVANPMLGAAGCLALRLAGWRRAELGLQAPSRRALSRCWWPGVLLTVAAAGGAAAGALNGGVTDKGLSVRISLLRLLVGTALGEELIHRGVLFPLWASTGVSPGGVVVANGLAFGAWHVAGVAPNGWLGRIAGVGVPATLGAAGFLWARCRSRSVAGAWLLHFSTNLPGLLFTRR
jgi:membrane protease YdiL (CAAX protease family)